MGNTGAELVGPPSRFPESASKFRPCQHRDLPHLPVICGDVVLGREECTK